MRNMNSVVKAEIVPALDFPLPESMLEGLTQEHREKISTKNKPVTLRLLLELLYEIAEVHIPNALALGDHVDDTLREDTLTAIEQMGDVFTPEAHAELIELYEQLEYADSDATGKYYSQLVYGGMTGMGLLTLEQNALISNGTGYVDHYVKLFDEREDGYYYQDRKIDSELFVCREALPRGRLIVMLFRQGRPEGAVFQRYTGDMESWARCEFTRELERHFESKTTTQILDTFCHYAHTRFGKA